MSKKDSEYRKEYAKEASKKYKAKMGELCDGNLSELQGSLRGEKRDSHLMYKLEDLEITGYDWMHYEFLIEYGIYEPSEGIYYGVKMVSEPGDGHDHDLAIKIAKEHWGDLMSVIPVVLNNVFIEKTFTPDSFRMTDNAENNTFWPFWISLHDEEDIKQVALVALQRIRAIYAHHLAGKPFSGIKCNIDSFGRKEWNTRFTRDSYDRMLKEFNEITHINDTQKDTKPAKLVEMFIARAVERGWLEKIPEYQGEIGYKFKGLSESKMPLSQDLPKLIKALWEYIQKKYMTDKLVNIQKGNNISPKIPWVSISKIFIDPKGKFYNPDIMPTAAKERAKYKKSTNWEHELKKLISDSHVFM